jgi:hypothetical protein
MSNRKQSDIASYFQAGLKRVFTSTSSEESDTSGVFDSDSAREKQARKRLNVDTSNMAIQEALEKITSRLDALDTLATKEDVTAIRTEMKDLTESFMKKIEKLEGRVFELETRSDKKDREVTGLKKKNEEIENKIRYLDLQVKNNERANNDLQQYSRRWNLRIYRVPEKEGETVDDCIQKMCNICTSDLKVQTTPADIQIAHRAGKPSRDKARPILVQFLDRKKRDSVFAARRALKGKGVVIGEDLTSENYKLLNNAFKHSATLSTWSSNGKILAKLKNGTVLRLHIHMDLDSVFLRAMKGRQSSEQDFDDEGQ